MSSALGRTRKAPGRGGTTVVGKSRGSGARSGVVRGRPGGPGARSGLRLVIACGLLGLLSLPIAWPPWRLDSNPGPGPPSAAQINAAENRVRQQQAALGAQQGRLSAAAAQLATLQTQAEVLTER